MARVLSLHNAGLGWPQGIDGKSAPKVYGFALKGLPGEALKRAVTKIIRGEIDGVTKFMPTPPELANLVRAEARPLIEDRARARETLDAYERGLPEKTPEAKARVRAMVDAFKRDHKAQKDASVRAARFDEPLTPEQEARYRAILDLPDRVGGPDADQADYRSRIQAKLAKAAEAARVAAEMPPIPDDVAQWRDFERDTMHSLSDDANASPRSNMKDFDSDPDFDF